MSWNKGRFGFWIVGKSYMRRRDAVQVALLEAQGQCKERLRIIKLLENERWVMPDGSPAGGEIYMPIEQAIALIKGENK